MTGIGARVRTVVHTPGTRWPAKGVHDGKAGDTQLRRDPARLAASLDAASGNRTENCEHDDKTGFDHDPLAIGRTKQRCDRHGHTSTLLVVIVRHFVTNPAEVCGPSPPSCARPGRPGLWSGHGCLGTKTPRQQAPGRPSTST